MTPFLKIGKKKITSKGKVFIIAEAGVNHNGDIEIAKKLIIEAKKSGADCVKFQTFKTENLVSFNSPKASYQKITTNKNETQFQMLKKLELTKKDHIELIKLCEKIDIIFLSTPYNITDIDLLIELKVDAFKVASMHIAEPYFIDYLSKKNKPFILSTGMSNIDEIDDAVKIIEKNNNPNYAILQCTTNYPSDYKDSNLNVIQTLINRYNKIVGYSDHTQGNLAPVVSVSLGAKIIEKHFTLDKSMVGPDHLASSDPREFSDLVKEIRKTELILGSYKKFLSKKEKINILNMRRSIVAKSDINRNQIIDINMLEFKRPRNGLHPKKYINLIGKKAKQKIKKDTVLALKMFE